MTAITARSRTNGIITALLVLLSLGLFGSRGWLAALVLALIAGALLGAIIHWLTDQGHPAMQGDDWSPEPLAVIPPQVSEPVPVPVVDAVAPITEARPAPDADHGIDPAEPDPLTAIKGIGRKMEGALHEVGVTRFAQIAAWDDAQIDAISAQIGRSAARIRSEDWVGQARAMDRDGVTP